MICIDMDQSEWAAEPVFLAEWPPANPGGEHHEDLVAEQHADPPPA
jgi:hypothetical protein